MTTPGQIIREYKTSPFELYLLKGKQFTIIEPLKANSQIREIKEKNKWNNMAEFFFITVEHGLFQKDLKVTKGELEMIFAAIPEASPICGAILEVDKMDKSVIKYMGVASQDINGNRIGIDTQVTGQNAPITQNQPVTNQTNGLDKLVSDMKYLNSVGTDITSAILMKMCDSIQPGRALDMIKQAKDAGYIFEQNGIFKPVS